MGSIQKIDRPKPWRARYRGPDGRQHSKSFRRKVDAERWLLTEESAALEGSWVDPKAGTILLGEYAESWLQARQDLAPKTVATYEALVRTHIIPAFGSRPLRVVSTEEIRSWQAALLAEGLSAATVRQTARLLRSILGQAVDDGRLARNAAAKVKQPSVRPRRQLFLTAAELGDLARECGEFGPLVWFLGWSGLRFGEAVALRAGRVDQQRRRVRVEEAATEVGGRLVFGPPKTYEARTVIVPRFVMDALAPLLEDREPDDLVFTAARGGAVRHGNFRSRVFAPAAERIGKPDLVPHDLRDTAASLMIASGASIKAVQRALGHASAKMTLDVYGSLFEEDLERLADTMEERYGSDEGDNVMRLPR
jgi:integrase